MVGIETDLTMVLWCLTLRWNHCLMGWGGCPLEALDGFWLMCSMWSHIHAWNMAWGWMVEESFGSAIWVEHGSSISDWFIAFINEKFIPLIFMFKCNDVYVDFMVDMFMIFLSLLCWLYVCFMATTIYGSQHVFSCTWMGNVFMT